MDTVRKSKSHWLNDQMYKGYIVYNSANRYENDDKSVITRREKVTNRENNANLNGSALDDDREGIVCRALSFHKLRLDRLDELKDSPELRQKSSYQLKFSDAISIRNEDNLKANTYDKEKVRFRADSYHCTPLAEFGQTIQNIARSMSPEDPSKHITVESENHLMSITIKQKSNGMIAIKFFDPNATKMHKRALFKNIDAVAALNINNFLSSKDEKSYFPQYKYCVLAIYNNPLELKPKESKIKLNTLDSSALKINTLDDLKQHNGLLFSGLVYNDSSIITSYMTKIKNFSNNGTLANQQLKELLLNSSDNGLPSLIEAFKNNNSEALITYIAAIKDFHKAGKLSQDDLKELLAAKSSSGNTGLYLANGMGNAEIVKTYMNETKKLHNEGILSKDALKELWAAKNNSGVPGVGLAFQFGHAELVKIYLAEIKELYNDDVLSKDEFKDLLLANGDDGISGLYMAFQENQVKIVQIYLAEINKLAQAGSLFQNEIKELIAAPRPGAPGGFLLALEQGQASVVKAYMGGLTELIDHQYLSKESFFALLGGEENFHKAINLIELNEASQNIENTIQLK